MNEDLIKSEILHGLQQVDETFAITSIFFDYDPKARTLKCSFTANTLDGEEVSEVVNYAE